MSEYRENYLLSELKVKRLKTLFRIPTFCKRHINKYIFFNPDSEKRKHLNFDINDQIPEINIRFVRSLAVKLYI